MKNQKLKGNLLLLLTAFVWGLSFIAQSKGVEEIDPITFNGVRSLLGALVLVPVIFVLDSQKKKNAQKVQGIDKGLITGGIVCGIFFTVASTLQTIGMQWTSPGKAAFITALYMIIVPVIGLFTGKKINIFMVIAVVIAIFGMYNMCIDPKEAFEINKGDVIVLICAFMFAGHILVIDFFSPRVDGVKLSCTQFLFCGIIGIVWTLIRDKNINFAVLWDNSLSIAYMGIMSCGVAYTLQIVAQKYTDPTSASILMSLESVFATLATVVLTAFGWQLTGGRLSVREISGCVLMFVAIMVVQYPELKEGIRKNKELSR